MHGSIPFVNLFFPVNANILGLGPQIY